MSNSQYTRIAIKEIIFALPVDQWQLRLVPDDEHHGSPVMSPTYTKAQLIHSISFLRNKNKIGYHIYGRPITNRHVLVDDLDQDALDQLHEDGLRPNVVVRTSQDNHQAWITISEVEVEPNVANAAARILAKRYGGDFGSTDAQHLGRLPGFTNRKNIYWTEQGYPFTGLHGRVMLGVSSGARKLLEEAIDPATSQPSLPSALGACAPTTTTDIDPSRSAMTEDEAVEIYDAEVKRLAELFAWQLPIQVGDRSDVDCAVSKSLWKYYGFNQDDLAVVLIHGSEKAAERGMGYAIRTVSNVCHRINQGTHTF
jgi:hypothetical protein